MLRLLVVFAIASVACLLVAGLDWVVGIGLVSGMIGLMAGLFGAIIGVGGAILGVLAGLAGVVLGLGSLLLIPALIIMGLAMLFRAA
jgi:hypothetical protein